MANVFVGRDSASDSSDSSARRRRRRPRLSLDDGVDETAPPAAAPSAVAGDGGDDDGGDDDEEGELRRLRKTRAYAQYANTFARDDAKSAREQRRAREAQAENAGAGGGEDDGPDADDERNANSDDGGDDDDGDDVGAPGPPPPPLLQADPSAPAPAPAPQPPPRRARRAIDPKIVDDSSDDLDSDDGALGPALPPAQSAAAAASAALDSLPLTHEASLGSTHDAHVCALSLDSAGSRFVTASVDSTLRLWDFGTMDSGLRSFRSVEPLGSSPVVSAQFSHSGGRILCAGALRVARILDRDARPLVESIPGDMYIVDMARTRGHVAPLNAAHWLADERFATIAGDATLRVWDAAAATAPASVYDGDLPRAEQLRVIKLRTLHGGKTSATAMAVLDGGKPRVAVGCEDGSIKVIDTEAFGLRPAAENARALSPGAHVTSLQHGGALSSLLLVRSTDDALRVFDVRRFDAPVAEFRDLPNAAAQTGVTFMGPNGSHFATGTSANRRGGTDCARLVVYDTRTLAPAWESAVERGRGSVIALAWHARINQLVYGCADGSVHVMYNPEASRAGVLQCLVKQVRRKAAHGLASVAVGEIHTPASLGAAGRKPAAAAVSAPARSDAPDPSKMTSSFTKAFMKSKVKATWADDDAQKALLRYHEAGDAKPVLADKTLEQEEEEALAALHARGGGRNAAKRPRRG
jgi:WD domain, G-beta repeat